MLEGDKLFVFALPNLCFMWVEGDRAQATRTLSFQSWQLLGCFSCLLYKSFFLSFSPTHVRRRLQEPNGKLYQSSSNFGGVEWSGERGGSLKLQDLFTVHLESSAALQVALLIEVFTQPSVDFHNAMLIYVQTIANNFSSAVSPLQYT